MKKELPPYVCGLEDAQIRAIALDCGFKLKQQLDGTEDLNPYVYKFAEEILSTTPSPEEVARYRKALIDGSPPAELQNEVMRLRKENLLLEQENAALEVEVERLAKDAPRTVIDEIWDRMVKAYHAEPAAYMDSNSVLWHVDQYEELQDESRKKWFTPLYVRPTTSEIELLRNENTEAKSIINEIRVLIQNPLPVDRDTPIWEMVKEFERKYKWAK